MECPLLRKKELAMIALHQLRRYAAPIIVELLASSLAAPHAAEPPRAVWPQWRGPSRDGHVDGAAWPAKLGGKALEQLWRVELGPSYSGPIVTPDRVFTTETIDHNTEVVRALERASGKELWRAQWQGAVTVPTYAKSNGEWIRATPAWDGESLYVSGMRDLLVCLNAANGKERWRVDFVAQYHTPVPPYGLVCSPLVDGDAVYVQAAASFIKLQKKTGKVLWRVLPYESTPNHTAVSSPALATLAGKRQVVVQQPKLLAGVDPASGETLWSAEVPAFRGFNIITPTLYKDAVLTSAFGGRTLLFRISEKDGKLTSEQVWSNSAQGYMSSPLVIGDRAFMHLRNQRVTCLDLRAGEERWITGETFGKYWSTVVNGDRILALDQRGILYLIRANPEKFEMLDSRKISDEETWAHLAVCGDQLFIREVNALTAYRWRPGQ
jgi:outer membrane protein assembly factor BamB